MASAESLGSNLCGVVRYLCRGTRWRSSKRREIPLTIAGHISDGETQFSIAQIQSKLVDSISRVGLSGSEHLAVSEYYGLLQYPLNLSSGDSLLVGSLATASGKVAGRSSVAALLKSASAKLDEVLNPKPLSSSWMLVPEVDPLERDWLEVLPPRSLSSVERSRLLSAALVGAQDFVYRADNAEFIRAGLQEWAVKHHVPFSELARSLGGGVSPRFEHRRAAFAALAVSLWEILHDGAALDRATSARSSGLVLVSAPVLSGRVAEQSKHGVVSSGGMDGDELVLLAGDVFEGKALDERTASAVLDEFYARRHEALLSEDNATTLVWAFGRGLAASESWKIVSLARWYSHTYDPDLTTASLLSWAGHVASLHLYDDLAWRLVAVAERTATELAKAGVASERRMHLIRFQVELVRSGCRLREADRLIESDELERAQPILIQAMKHLASAQVGWQSAGTGEDGALVKRHVLEGMSLDLRAMEIVFLAARMRRLGSPVSGFDDELPQLQERLTAARGTFDANRRPDDPDDDVLEQRIELLESVVAEEFRLG